MYPSVSPCLWIDGDASFAQGNTESDNEKFEMLKTAIIQCKTVKIRYASSYEMVSQRKIITDTLCQGLFFSYINFACCANVSFK